MMIFSASNDSHHLKVAFLPPEVALPVSFYEDHPMEAAKTGFRRDSFPKTHGCFRPSPGRFRKFPRIPCPCRRYMSACLQILLFLSSLRSHTRRGLSACSSEDPAPWKTPGSPDPGFSLHRCMESPFCCHHVYFRPVFHPVKASQGPSPVQMKAQAVF